MDTGVRTKALHRAVEVVGGKERLRELLDVSEEQLDAWLAGDGTPPITVFLKAVDLIVAAPPPISIGTDSDAILRSRRLRREAAIVRTGAMRARERAIEIQAAILAGHAARPARYVSPLAFLQQSFRPDEGLQMVAAAVAAAVNGSGANRGNLQLLCPEGLRIVAHQGFEKPFLDFFGCVREDSSFCGIAMKQRRRVIIPDVANDSLFVNTPAAKILEQARVRAVQSTPILAVSGEVLGMLSTHYERPYLPSERELDAVDRITRRAAFWLEAGET